MSINNKQQLQKLVPLIKRLAGIFERVTWNSITEHEAETEVKHILISPRRQAYFLNMNNLSDGTAERFHALYTKDAEFYDECRDSIDEFME